MRARGEADGVVAGGEDDPAYALLARRLVEVVRALDVGPQDLVEGGLQGDAREVDDRVDASYGLAQRVLVGEVGGDRVRVRPRRARGRSSRSS